MLNTVTEHVHQQFEHDTLIPFQNYEIRKLAVFTVFFKPS